MVADYTWRMTVMAIKYSKGIMAIGQELCEEPLDEWQHDTNASRTAKLHGHENYTLYFLSNYQM